MSGETQAVWIDGDLAMESIDIYRKLEAYTPGLRTYALACIRRGLPFNGHVTRLHAYEPCGAIHQAAPVLLADPCTHRLGYNPGRF